MTIVEEIYDAHPGWRVWRSDRGIWYAVQGSATAWGHTLEELDASVREIKADWVAAAERLARLAAYSPLRPC